MEDAVRMPRRPRGSAIRLVVDLAGIIGWWVRDLVQGFKFPGSLLTGWEGGAQAKARSVRDGKGALVLLLNNHFMLKKTLAEHTALSRLVGRYTNPICCPTNPSTAELKG